MMLVLKTKLLAAVMMLLLMLMLLVLMSTLHSPLQDLGVSEELEVRALLFRAAVEQNLAPFTRDVRDVT